MDSNVRKGDRVRLVLKNGMEYTGDVKGINTGAELVLITNITDVSSGFEISGNRYFEGCEIEEIKKLTASSRCDKPDPRENQIETSVKRSTEQEESELPQLNDLTFEYFDSFSDEFHKAVSILKESEIIGLCAKDCSKGRGTRASVVATATGDRVFIFDVSAMGDKLFREGLRDVLQSPTVRKIVHDCRFLSDCLHHNHETHLSNVRDVEAEDIMVVFQQRGSVRKHSRPFPYLVDLYLNVRGDALNDGNLSWSERPLTDEHKKHLAAFASLLVPLHKRIEEHYLERLADASKIYNEYIRDSDPYTAITKGSKYVLVDQIIEIVKYKDTCRGSKYS